MGLGKLGRTESLPGITAMLEKNADADPFLRHAGVMAFVGINEPKELAKLSRHKSASVRLAAVVALRKLESPEITAFLKDAEPAVVVEAVRAINDAPINKAMPQMAALLNADTAVASSKWSQPFHLRAINANFRVGASKNAEAVATFAATGTAPEDMRVEALVQLAQWPTPPARDRIMGVFRPIVDGTRKATTAASALTLAGLADPAFHDPGGCFGIAFEQSSGNFLNLWQQTGIPKQIRYP